MNLHESEVLSAEGRKFVGIGKIIFKTEGKWNIPHLHFFVEGLDGESAA